MYKSSASIVAVHISVKKNMMKKHIPYAISNYAEIIRKNSYFVDKTQYIEKLERIENPVFLRPRRFGKSLLYVVVLL